VIALIGQKGGGGKTTTCLNLAVAAAQAGKAAVVIDIDQQANAAKWKDRRKPENVAVVATPLSRIRQTVETARSHGAEFILIDTPGHSDSAAIEAARASDLVIVPVKPQMFHFETLTGMRDLVRIAGDKPAWAVLNELHPSATTQAEELKALVARAYPFPVCPVHLSRLDVFATSADVGLTPLEQDPKGKAATEVKLLYKFVCQQVHQSRSPHAQAETLATGA
jgi:chromosome partitioning protein